MTDDTAEFGLRDAFEVLRLLDEDQDGTFDVRCHGLRLQCVRGASPSPVRSNETGDGAFEEARRRAMLKAPAAGRFYGDATVFSGGERPVRVTAGTIVGRIEAGAKVTAIVTGVAGTIAHACVTARGFVEYGQTLLVIDVD